MQEKVQRMSCISLFTFINIAIKVQGQACNGLSDDSDTSVNRRRLHGVFLRHLFAGKGRSKEKPEYWTVLSAPACLAFE